MCLLNSESRTPRTFLLLGMVSLTLAILLPIALPARALSVDLLDFFKGMLYGLSFAFSIGSIVARRRPPSNTAS